MGGIVDSITGKSGKSAAKESREASEIQAGAQREALEYLKETERLPQQFREEALTELAGYYQPPGADPTQQQLISEAQQSPLYGLLSYAPQMSDAAKEKGEQAILKSASATGGLRSGNVQGALYDYASDLEFREQQARDAAEKEALLRSFTEAQGRSDVNRDIQLRGLSGLASLPSYASEIASGTAGIGRTLGQGRVAGAQAEMQGAQAGTQNALGLASLAAQAFSDIRLKDNIKYIGDRNGHRWYSWDWSESAHTLGLEGSSEGVMAHLVNEYMPEAISEQDGYITVDYDLLGVSNAL